MHTLAAVAWNQLERYIGDRAPHQFPSELATRRKWVGEVSHACDAASSSMVSACFQHPARRSEGHWALEERRCWRRRWRRRRRQRRVRVVVFRAANERTAGTAILQPKGCDDVSINCTRQHKLDKSRAHPREMATNWGAPPIVEGREAEEHHPISVFSRYHKTKLMRVGKVVTRPIVHSCFPAGWTAPTHLKMHWWCMLPGAVPPIPIHWNAPQCASLTHAAWQISAVAVIKGGAVTFPKHAWQLSNLAPHENLQPSTNPWVGQSAL